MTIQGAGKHDHQPIGDGRAHCRAVGMASVALFVKLLMERAGRQPLTVADLREEYALFGMGESEDLRDLFDQAYAACDKGSTPLKNRRRLAFEAVLVKRIEKAFDLPGSDGQQLSRRVIPGFIFALTQLLGEELYDEARIQAAAIAMSYGDGADLSADDHIRRIADEALIHMAVPFHDDFPETLKYFIHAVNSRLGEAVPGAWDADWMLTRRLAVSMLEDLYAGLHEAFVSGHLGFEGSEEAFPILAAFFAGLNDARAVADKPWLLRPLRY